MIREVWSKQHREAIGEMLCPDSIIHEGIEEIRGPEGFYRFFDRMQAAFSDIRMTIEDEIAQENKTCVPWSSSVRQTGSELGLTATTDNFTRQAYQL
jgi:hypothetical protein